MDDNELNKIVDAWIAAHELANDSPEREECRWAVDRVMDWKFEGQPELLWRFVLSSYERKLTDKVIAVLAAGPLEDLISEFGADYIERIETLARRDPKFNFLLGGVWRSDTRDDVWKRIEAVRLKVW